MSGTWLPGRKKITLLDANEIRTKFANHTAEMVTTRYRLIAAEYGVAPRTVERIVKGHTHTTSPRYIVHPDKASTVDLSEEL